MARNRLHVLMMSVNAIFISAVLLMFILLVFGQFKSPLFEVVALGCGITASFIVILLWRASVKRSGGT